MMKNVSPLALGVNIMFVHSSVATAYPSDKAGDKYLTFALPSMTLPTNHLLKPLKTKL